MNSEQQLIHLFREWSGRVSFMCLGIRQFLINHDCPKEIIAHMDDVLSWTPNRLSQLVDAMNTSVRVDS